MGLYPCSKMYTHEHGERSGIMAEEKVFHNSKELLESCFERLSENQSGEVGGNVAKYPTVVVMLGEKSRAYTKYIKSTLDDNWNNSGFLQYVGIVKKGDSWECVRLAQAGRKREFTWENASGEPDEIVSKAIVEMLEQDERIFKDKSSIKMEFVMDATEEDGESYYDLYLRLKNGLHSADLKTFYLMLDQKPEGGKNEKSDHMLQYVLRNRNNPGTNCGTTYLLSNYLDSGSILGENKIWQNYRLVADIILLGGNRTSAGDSGYVTNLYNGIKTASYALVTKPTDEIAAVSLQALLEEMYQQEEAHHDVELTDKEIRERLDIKATHGFGFAEEIFREKILKQLPSAGDLRYLPFRSEKDLREMQKADQVSARMADSYTMGMWSLFQQEKYIDVAQRFLEDEEELRSLYREIQDRLHGAFSLFEARKLTGRRDLIRQLLLEDLRFDGVSARSDYTEKLHRSAVYECKKYFYDRVKQIMAEEFDRLLDQTKQYEDLYARCRREVRQERIVTGDEDKSIEKTYAGEVKRYVEKRQKINSRESAFPEVFDARSGQEDMLSAVRDVFSDLIREEIFNYDFEKELDFRMSSMTDVNRQVYVTQELQRALSGSVRLKNLTSVMTKMSCFYLINDSADYAKQLARQEGHGRDFMLFNLNRTDCIEQIEIYNITKPENLHLNL